MTLTSRRSDIIPYPVKGPYMDAGRHPLLLERGTFSRLVGVDGRYVGSLRPYPGHQALTFGTDKHHFSDVSSGLTTITFCKYVLLQRGTSSDVLRGFLVRGDDGEAVKLVYIYYDTSTSAWASHEVDSGSAVSDTVAVDVTSYGQFMYVFVAGDSDYPRTVWHDGTSWNDKAMGPVFTSLAAPTLAEGSGGTGKIDAGTYGVAYRFYDSTRSLYSAMSSMATITTETDDNEIDVTVPHPDDSTDVYASFDTIELFRTISVTVADSTFDGGVLYHDADITLSASWETGDKTGEVGENYEDVQQVQQSMYDPWEDVAGTPPCSGAAIYYQGSVFAAEAEDGAGGGGGIRWSRVTAFDPENFSASHKYRGGLGDGVVEGFVQVGEILYALTDSVVYRIHKVGTQLSIHRLHEGRGTTDGDSAHAVGGDLLYVAPIGLTVMGGPSADLQVQTQVDRILKGDWAGDLDSVVGAYDSYMGASYLVNTVDAEALVLWHVTKSATMLKNCHFVAATTGPLPESGGPPRAFFVTNEGRVCYPDHDRSGTGTMMGASGTLNGTATSSEGDKTTLVDSTATFDENTLDDAYVYMVTGDNAGEYRKVAVRYSETRLATDAFPNNITSGDQYVISPVVFEMRLPPVPSSTEGVPLLQRRVIETLGLYATGHSGVSSNENAQWKVSAYREGGTSLADTAKWIDMADGRVTTQFADTDPGSLHGFLLEPYVGAYLAGVDFELTGIEVMARMSKGRSLS